MAVADFQSIVTSPNMHACGVKNGNIFILNAVGVF
jgi:hypothetical protein